MYRIKSVLMNVLLICMLLQTISLPAYANKISNDVFDPDELQKIVDEYIEQKDLNPELIAIGYVNTATGECWYFNPDQWFYSASLYKVPLMMLLAEQEAEGKIQSDTEIYGVPFSDLEYDVLANSNNHYAALAFEYLGGYTSCREQFRKYSSLPEEYYHPDYLSYSYFTARFMTDVMSTLFYQSDSFPRVIEDLKDAQPGHYFRLTLGDEEYEIAQKYGFYEEWKHTAGIVYTANPFILTVLTRYDGLYEMIISDLALLFRDYTLRVDEKLSQFTAEDNLPAEVKVESITTPLPELPDSREEFQLLEKDMGMVTAIEQENKQDTLAERKKVLVGATLIVVLLSVSKLLLYRKKKR